MVELTSLASLPTFIAGTPVPALAVVRARLRNAFHAPRQDSNRAWVERIVILLADESGTFAITSDVQSQRYESPQRGKDRADMQTTAAGLIANYTKDAEYVVEFSNEHLIHIMPCSTTELPSRGTNTLAALDLPSGEHGTAAWPVFTKVDDEGRVWPDPARPTKSRLAPGYQLPSHPLPDYSRVGEISVLEGQVWLFSCVCCITALQNLTPVSTDASPTKPGAMSSTAYYRLSLQDTPGKVVNVTVFKNAPPAIMDACTGADASEIIKVPTLALITGLIQRGPWVNLGSASRIVPLSAASLEAFRAQLPEGVMAFLTAELTGSSAYPKATAAPARSRLLELLDDSEDEQPAAAKATENVAAVPAVAAEGRKKPRTTEKK